MVGANVGKGLGSDVGEELGADVGTAVGTDVGPKVPHSTVTFRSSLAPPQR